MHISKQNASDKQPLYPQRRATWATFAPTTASVCFKNEFNYMLYNIMTTAVQEIKQKKLLFS